MRGTPTAKIKSFQLRLGDTKDFMLRMPPHLNKFGGTLTVMTIHLFQLRFGD